MYVLSCIITNKGTYVDIEHLFQKVVNLHKLYDKRIHMAAILASFSCWEVVITIRLELISNKMVFFSNTKERRIQFTKLLLKRAEDKCES